MRKLLIVDPSLISLEGHSYNYDLAIYQEARKRFDDVIVYSDRDFRDDSGQLAKCRPVLNRLRLERLKRWANTLFHALGRKPKAAAQASPHATVVPGVWTWLIGLVKWLRARDLESSLHSILREQRGDGVELHVFFQHAHFAELLLADRIRDDIHLHIVLRYSPELVNAGQLPVNEFSALLKKLDGLSTPKVHLYTDSERLSAEYLDLGARRVRTLPVPILIPDAAASLLDTAASVNVAFLGAARVEKGFCELGSLIERFPRLVAGRKIAAMVQVSADSADPRVRAATDGLSDLAKRLPPGALELLQSPVPMEIYYGWFARAGIVALPYLSKKYNASTSGIFVEALCFGVPVVCPADSWMADVIAEAAASKDLRIGEVVQSIGEIPGAVEKIAAALPQYRADVRQFAGLWRKTHNAEACVRILLETARA